MVESVFPTEQFRRAFILFNRITAVLIPPLLILFLSCASFVFAADDSEPTLVVSKPIFDFGTISQGQPVQHDFVIRNSGSSELQIRKILPACGCTAAVVASDRISPGESTEIKVQFDTAGFQGYKVKTIRLYTNDPKQTSTVLTIQGTIRPEIAVTPLRLNFGNVRRGTSPEDEVVVSSTIQGFAIKSVRPRSEEIQVVNEPLAEGKGARLKISLKDTLPVGIFRSRIAVLTNNKKTPVINVPIFAKVRGDLSFSRSSVSFGLLEGPLKEPTSQEVILTNTSSEPIGILSVKSDHPNVSAKIDELEPGKKFTVRVSLAGTDAGAVRAKIKINTNHKDPDQRLLVLPVYAIVTRSNA